MMGIQRWAPIRFEIKLDGSVNMVKSTEYTIIVTLTPSLVNPRSFARSSEMALASKEHISKLLLAPVCDVFTYKDWYDPY